MGAPSWRRPGKKDVPKKDESPAEERGLLNKLQSIPLGPFSNRLQEVQAHAEDYGGDTTRRLVEHDKKEGQTRSTLRRKVRVAAWFVQVLVFWGCWKLFNFTSQMSAITQRYDPKVGIDLEVRGCDVDFTAGDEPTVTYTARMMAAHASWHKSTSDSTITQYATVSNNIGCGGLRPGDGCRRVCLVTVSVTPEAARLSTFRIDQEADDTDSPTISLMPQTSIATLLVSPAVDPPSMDLVISHASITSQLTAKLGFGGMTARRSSLPKGSAVEAVGSIYLYGVNTPTGSTSDTCTVGSDAAGSDWQEASRSTVPAWPGIQSFAGEVVDVSNPNMDPTKGVKSHDLPVPYPVLGVRDATRITEAYASDFGDRGSSGGSVYITFDLAGSDGLPAARFVYTTNPFFLYLDPAALLFLTAGVLVPPTFHEELHFTGFDCDLGPGAAMSTGARNATLIAVAHEIEKVLHSDPEDERPLRGLLVLVGNQPHEHMPMLWGEPPLFEIPDPSSGQTRPKQWENPTIASTVKLSLMLVATVGVLVGALATYAAFRHLAQVSIDLWMLDEANEKLVCMKRYAEEGEKKYLEERAAEGEERMRPSGNPFKSPFRLITKFSIVPLRKKMLDSLPLFIEANLSKVPVGKGMGLGAKAPQADRYIWMSDFLRHYELYCLDQNLTMEVSKEKIQQELVSEHGCSVKVLTLSRVYGLRWKTKPEPRLLRAIPEDRAAGVLGGKSMNPEKVVRDFIEAKCDVSGLDYIDLESRFGKYGTMEMGFGAALEAWAKQQGLPMPKLELTNEKWCKAALPEGVKVRLNMTAKQVRGLAFKKANDEVTIAPEWYMQEAATVMMHVGLYVPPLFMAVYAMWVQNYYSIYICSPSDADPLLHPLTWLDANLPLSEVLRTRQMAPETRIILGEVFVFSLLTLVRQLFHYMAVEQASEQDEWSFRSVFKIIEISFSHVYGVIATLQIFVFTSFVGIVACWFLLATALDPTVFLPCVPAALPPFTLPSPASASPRQTPLVEGAAGCPRGGTCGRCVPSHTHHDTCDVSRLRRWRRVCDDDHRRDDPVQRAARIGKAHT